MMILAKIKPVTPVTPATPAAPQVVPIPGREAVRIQAPVVKGARGVTRA